MRACDFGRVCSIAPLDYRDVPVRKAALPRTLAPQTSAPAKQGGRTRPTMFCEAARPNADSRGTGKQGGRYSDRLCFARTEAASPSFDYCVLAVRKGGGIGSGCLARRLGGFLHCRAGTFVLRAPSFTPANRSKGCIQGLSLSDACSDTAYRDACTIGNWISLNVAQHLFCDTTSQKVKLRSPPSPFFKGASLAGYFSILVFLDGYSSNE